MRCCIQETGGNQYDRNKVSTESRRQGGKKSRALERLCHLFRDGKTLSGFKAEERKIMRCGGIDIIK